MDKEYTSKDHEYRGEDYYAVGKYNITLRLMRRYGGGLLNVTNIGSGAGLFSYMAQKDGYRVTSYEPDGDAVRLSKCLYPDIEVIEKGLENINSFERGSIIVMHDVLEHIEDDERALEKIRRMASKEDLIIVSVPAWQFLYGYHDEKLGHYRRYSKRRLRRLISQEFEILRFRNYCWTGIVAAFINSRLLRKEYSTGKSGGLKREVIKLIFRLESRIPCLIGSSAIVVAKPK